MLIILWGSVPEYSDKACVIVKEGDEVPVGGIGFLEEAGETEGQHMVPHAAVFAVGDPAVEPGYGDIITGDVLAHEADRGTGREAVTDPGQEPEGLAGEAGQDQMADERAAEHDAVRVVARGAGLAAHFRDRRGGPLKVIRCAGAEPAGVLGIMLEIGQVHVDDPVEAPQGFDRFIPGGVPYQGERRSPELQGFQDPRDEGRRGDEGNRMHPEIGQAFQGVGKLLGRKNPAGSRVGDFPVLAVCAAESAAGKKYGAGSPGTGKTLIAKAVASKADVTFIRMSGSDLVQKFVGEGARLVKDIFAMADIVVSRAGANSICELLALKKPNILIPLSPKSSRGDQMLNARSFE